MRTAKINIRAGFCVDLRKINALGACASEPGSRAAPTSGPRATTGVARSVRHGRLLTPSTSGRPGEARGLRQRR